MAVTSIQNDLMPPALGPYSQAVSARGELVFVSGQPGIDPESGSAPGEFEQQGRMAFENLSRVLAAAGLRLSDVAKTTIYLADPAHFGSLNSLFGEYFPANPPTRAAPVVQLPKGLLISIEAVAVRS